MKDQKVILASNSPRRWELLHQIEIQPEIMPSQIEELTTSQLPEEIVVELSLKKAEDVADRTLESALIIGADTIVAVDGMILGKPKSHEDAYKMLKKIQGRSHEVYTGVTLIYKEKGRSRERSFVEKTEVSVYPMTEKEMKSYADSKEPMDKAGAYGIQGGFAAYIEGIHGDYNNVVGLPIGRVYQEWKKLMEDEEN